MRCKDYRQSMPGKSSRAAFIDWINPELNKDGVNLSIDHLRHLEQGERIPSLVLALSIERATGGVVSVREWPGLTLSLRA